MGRPRHAPSIPNGTQTESKRPKLFRNLDLPLLSPLKRACLHGTPQPFSAVRLCVCCNLGCKAMQTLHAHLLQPGKQGNANSTCTSPNLLHVTTLDLNINSLPVLTVTNRCIHPGELYQHQVSHENNCFVWCCTDAGYNSPQTS